MASLTGKLIKDTYQSLLKLIDNGNVTSTPKEITDGEGNGTGVSLSNDGSLDATGTVSFGSLKDSGENITVTKFVDEADGIGNNNNDTTIPTSAAVKNYVDTNVTAQDLDFQGDSGTGAVDLDSQSLDIAGGTGIDTSAVDQTLTVSIDSTVATLSDTQTLTNKSIDLTDNTLTGTTAEFNTALSDDDFATLTGTEILTNKTVDADNNTVSNLEVDNLKSGVLDTDLTSVSASDDTLASAKAIKTYVDTQITAEDLDFSGNTGTGDVDLDSEVFEITGSNGITTIALDNTLEIDGTTLQTDIATNAANIATNATNIASNDTDISALDTRVTFNEGNITTLFGDVNTNSINIATNVTNIENNDTDISNLDTRVTTNEGNISTNTTNISTNATNISSNDTDITNLQNNKYDKTGGAISGDVSITGDLTVDTDTLFVDASENRVGIGTDSPSRKFVVSRDNASSIVGSFQSENNQGVITFVGSDTTNDTQVRIGAEGNDLLMYSGSAERMRIDSTGRVSINGLSNGADLTILEQGSTSVLLQSTGGLFMQSGSATSLVFQTDGANEKMRIDSDGNVGIGATNISEKLQIYQGSTGTDAAILIRGNRFYDTSANVYVKYDINSGAVNNGRVYKWETGMEGDANGQDFVFKSTTTGGTTERMRIDSSGNVQVNNGNIYLVDLNKRLTVDGNDIRIWQRSSANIQFLTADQERMRIASGGQVMIGKTLVDNRYSGLLAFEEGQLNISKDGTASSDVMQFFRNFSGTPVGSISTTSTSTSYNESSDYRLKENVVELTGALDRVDALNPSRFNFISDADTIVDGFLAHEVQEVVPQAVTGEKDAVDEDGNPIYQGIDHSKLVPLLTKAIQEQQEIINDLKSRIETLENN